MKTILSKPSGQTITREARDYLMIALGMILYGIGWTLFLLPNDITTGGVPGIASIVYFATGFPVQYTYFAIQLLYPEGLGKSRLRICNPLCLQFCAGSGGKQCTTICSILYYLHQIRRDRKTNQRISTSWGNYN